MAENIRYEYEIDLYSGAVLKNSAEQKGNHQDAQQTQPAQTQPAQTQASTQASSGNYIGETAALNAALSHAGVAEGDLTERKVELDRDDGRMIYEIEFKAGRMEYEYDVDALTGDILKAESDWDD